MKQQSFDYIIIGAGSAGCVLANKLGSDLSKSILIVEAGPPDCNLMIHIPAGVYSAYRNPKLNWNYQTENEPNTAGRAISMPRGRVVGGSSSINSMVYMRGHPRDYDRWQSECGLKNWSFAQYLPYFKAGETSDRGASAYRGGAGPLGVTRGSFDNPLYDAFLEAGTLAGQGRTEDPSGYQPEGLCRLDATRWAGRRSSAAVAHLRPALKRGNVTLLTEAQVSQIIVSGNRGTGIEFTRKGRLDRAAAQEVLLCGGAINSPHLLMLSGIGPKAHLAEHDIPLRVDLPGVGQNLQDHATVVLQYACTKRFDIHRVDQLPYKTLAGARWVFTRKGIAASNIWEAGGLIKSGETAAYADLQYHFGPIGFEFTNGRLKLRQGFSIHVDLLRPRSTGEIRLASADPMVKPHLHFNYLEQSEDLTDLVEGVKRTRELIAQTPFDPFRGAALEPSDALQTDADLANWVRQNLETDYHPSCTCKMEDGSDAVVGQDFKVHGIEGLRVVDASVMPQIISGNLNASVQMIAARAADSIANRPVLPAEHVDFAFQSANACV